MLFGFMDVILFYSDHQYVWDTHMAIFRVAIARIQNIFIECQDHFTVKSILFWLKFQLNSKTVTSTKY